MACRKQIVSGQTIQLIMKIVVTIITVEPVYNSHPWAKISGCNREVAALKRYLMYGVLPLIGAWGGCLIL